MPQQSLCPRPRPLSELSGSCLSAVFFHKSQGAPSCTHRGFREGFYQKDKRGNHKIRDWMEGLLFLFLRVFLFVCRPDNICPVPRLSWDPSRLFPTSVLKLAHPAKDRRREILSASKRPVQPSEQRQSK